MPRPKPFASPFAALIAASILAAAPAALAAPLKAPAVPHAGSLLHRTSAHGFKARRASSRRFAGVALHSTPIADTDLVAAGETRGRTSTADFAFAVTRGAARYDKGPSGLNDEVTTVGLVRRF